VRQIDVSLAGAATVTIEREQLIGQARQKLRHTHAVDDLTCLSMDVRDCIRYKNTLKHFIHLRISSKSVTARFAA